MELAAPDVQDGVFRNAVRHAAAKDLAMNPDSLAVLLKKLFHLVQFSGVLDGGNKADRLAEKRQGFPDWRHDIPRGAGVEVVDLEGHGMEKKEEV